MNQITNPNEIKQMQGVLQEIADAMLQISAHQEQIKEIKIDALETFKDKITAKQLNKLAKTFYKDNYNQEVADAEEFQYLFETILGTQNNGN